MIEYTMTENKHHFQIDGSRENYTDVPLASFANVLGHFVWKGWYMIGGGNVTRTRWAQVTAAALYALQRAAYDKYTIHMLVV